MSPRPPPPPIPPRDASLSAVSGSPRPPRVTTFGSTQRPLHLQTSGSYAPHGLILAPISGGSTMPQHHPPAPHPQHIPPTQHSSAPYLPPSQPDFNNGWVSMSYHERPLAFSSPVSSSAYSTPASFPYDQQIEHTSPRKYSHEVNRRRV